MGKLGEAGSKEPGRSDSPRAHARTCTGCVEGDQPSSAPQRLFTFTISWAKIPPTTAHTGAISEKQYLEERTHVMKC